jgi:hypothetical protein
MKGWAQVVGDRAGLSRADDFLNYQWIDAAGDQVSTSRLTKALSN